MPFRKDLSLKDNVYLIPKKEKFEVIEKIMTSPGPHGFLIAMKCKNNNNEVAWVPKDVIDVLFDIS